MATEIKVRKQTFQVKSSDFWAGVHAWEPDTFDVLDTYMGRGKVLLDIGAWNGVCSLYAASLGAVSYAVEPDLTAYAELLENIEANPEFKIFPIPSAVTAHDGVAQLYNFDKFGNSMSSTQLVRGQSYEVPSQRLETLAASLHFDLLKLDIESAELVVIPDALEFLVSRQKPVYVSTHPYWYPHEKDDERRLMAHFNPHFTLTRVDPDSWLCLPNN